MMARDFSRERSTSVEHYNKAPSINSKPSPPPLRRAHSELGGFKEQRPRKVLFLTDGRTPAEVRDALTANTLDRGVESIVMLFERPLMAALVGDADQNAMM